MACQIKKLAEYILTNYDEKSKTWRDVSSVLNENKSTVVNNSQVEFNKLPSYKEGQKNMTYAGIGSRETPKDVLELMTKAAEWLASKGYKLQTGKTFHNREEGADKAFSDGTRNKELFGPEEATELTKTIAIELHPAPQYLKEGGLKLMARNTNQVFGKNLDTPVDFVLFYAIETDNPLRPKGGTGQAVEMARRKGIPTINMANKDWRKQLTEVLKSPKKDTEQMKENADQAQDMDTEKNNVERAATVIDIKGYKIKFHTVPKGSMRNIASTNSRTKEIKLQEGITAVDVAAYLSSENAPETRLKVLKILKNKYGVDFNVLLRNMQNSPQLLRKFLLLHEYRHLQQITKRDSAEEFNRAYKEDPVKFELDAGLFALRTLREEIEIVDPYADLTLQAYQEVQNSAIAEPVKVIEQKEEVNEPIKENVVDAVDALVREHFTDENLQQILVKIANKDKYVFSDMYSPYKEEMDSDSTTEEEWDNYREATNKIRSMYMKHKVNFNDISKISKEDIKKVFRLGGRENPDAKYEIFPEVYANEEQRVAIDVLSEFLKGSDNSILLKGRGGVGKTSIIAKVLDNSKINAKNIHYITPTNKATKILKLMSEKANGITGSLFLTVAQALSYQMKNGKLVRKLDKYGNPVPPKVLGDKFTPKAKVIVVDESSMLDKGMFDTLQEIVKQNKDMKIIYMGDNVQLPPVNENSHVSSVFKSHTNSSRVELTKRMRQKAESPILPITDVLAKAVETRVNLDGSPVADTSKHSEIKFAAPTNSEVRYVTRENSMKEFIDKLKAEPESTRWIMFNNNEHAEGIKVTEMVRKALFGAEAAKAEYIKGEQLYITSPYQDGEVLNTGDELTVQSILKENELTPIKFEYWDNTNKRYATTTVELPVTALVVKENLLQEILEVNVMTKESMKVIRTLPEGQQYGIKQALLQSSPAYVLTSHKAQGSTYKNVYADIGNIFKNPKNVRVDNIQSAYVATSRASESLVMVDVPVQYRENTKEQLKQEQDIILPNEVVRNNINKKIECKD